MIQFLETIVQSIQEESRIREKASFGIRLSLHPLSFTGAVLSIRLYAFVQVSRYADEAFINHFY